MSAEYSVVMCEAWPWFRLSMIYCFALRLVSDMRHVSVPGFGRPVLCRSKMPRARGMAAYVIDGYGPFR